MFYISKRKYRKTIIVHKGDCFTCNNGSGRENRTSGKALSEWFGPFPTEDDVFNRIMKFKEPEFSLGLGACCFSYSERKQFIKNQSERFGINED